MGVQTGIDFVYFSRISDNMYLFITNQTSPKLLGTFTTSVKIHEILNPDTDTDSHRFVNLVFCASICEFSWIKVFGELGPTKGNIQRRATHVHTGLDSMKISYRQLYLHLSNWVQFAEQEHQLRINSMATSFFHFIVLLAEVTSMSVTGNVLHVFR